MNISNNNNTTREAGTDRISGTSKSDSCKESASSKSNECVCDVNDMLNNMSTADISTDGVSVCANCGKEGSDNVMNTCNKCKQVKYCNAACKKKHRSKHKKQCERRAAELHDIELFKQPPQFEEECPICFTQLPYLVTGTKYMYCCGKVICLGCAESPVYDNQGNKVDNKICPFCRTPWHNSNKELIIRMDKRVEAGDAYAIYNLGWKYREGSNGFPQDYNKALELYHRAADLGYSRAYNGPEGRQ